MKLVFICLTLLITMLQAKAQQTDWLINPPSQHASAQQNGKELVLSNGLLQRVFRLQPNLACISYKNLSTDQELPRPVKPEARLILDGKTYNIGGLHGQKENAYLLPAWLDEMTNAPNDFQYVSYTVTPLQPYLNWRPKGWTGNPTNATGILATFTYRHPNLPGVVVKVNYEVYDGL